MSTSEHESQAAKGVTGNCPYWTAEEQLMHDRIAIREVANTARQEGRLQGLLEARQEGLLAARQEGVLEGKKKIVVNMYELGYPIAVLSQGTKLPEAQVEAIIAEYERSKKVLD